MVIPANLQVAFVTVGTSGVANTVTTGTLVAAPGASKRTRLWAYKVGPTNTAQAVVNWRAILLDQTPALTLALESGATMASPPVSWLPGGLVLAANSILQYSIQSALASLALGLFAYYTTEAVA